MQNFMQLRGIERDEVAVGKSVGMEEEKLFLGHFHKSITSEPNGISKRSKRLWIQESEIFLHAKYER